ncbi:tail fiber domain-containing protein [Photobacterium damselae]|uniref:tail fiber domain-containing protein n=1 Tax=Photobacterium damselae TaxID=38293 RepID=UPI00165DB83A|nr:tail fiber domain-containing protein [Photobacterium damselae]
MENKEIQEKSQITALKINKASKRVETLNSFQLYENGQRVYSPHNKPTADAIGAVKELRLGGIGDHQRAVVLLHKISGGGSDYRYFTGTIALRRSNGLYEPYRYEINTQKAYSSSNQAGAYGRIYSLGADSSENYLCTCMYGGNKYVALHVGHSDAQIASTDIWGEWSETPVKVIYKTKANGSNAEVINNTEINGSLVKWQDARIPYTNLNKPTAADVGALPANGKAVDADKIDGVDSSQLLQTSGDRSFSGALVSTARDKGIFGTYDSYKTDQIWSMGTAYKNHSAGTNFGNLYGLAYKHTNNATGGTMAGGHQMVWCVNGSPKAALGESGIWTNGSMTFAPTSGVSIIDFQNTGSNNDRGWIKHKNSSTTASMEFCVSDDPVGGDDYFTFGAATGNASNINAPYTEWFKVNRHNVYYKGSAIYHEGHKPTPAEVGAVNKAGDTMTGKLSVMMDTINICDYSTTATPDYIKIKTNVVWNASKMLSVRIKGNGAFGNSYTYPFQLDVGWYGYNSTWYGPHGVLVSSNSDQTNKEVYLINDGGKSAIVIKGAYYTKFAVEFINGRHGAGALSADELNGWTCSDMTTAQLNEAANKVTVPINLISSPSSFDSRFVKKSGDTMTGALTVGSQKIIGTSSGYYLHLGAGNASPTIGLNASCIIAADMDGSGSSEYISLKAGAGTPNELKVLSKTASDGVNNSGLHFNGYSVYHAGFKPTELYSSATRSINVSDHGGTTWFRNDANKWFFQGGTRGDDFTNAFGIEASVDSTTMNSQWIHFGQLQNNGTNGGQYRGVAVIKTTGSSTRTGGDLSAGRFKQHGVESYLQAGGTGSWRVQNDNGNMEFGPMNGSHCHIYTDRPSFYFNKELFVNGNQVFRNGFAPTLSSSGRLTAQTDATTSNHTGLKMVEAYNNGYPETYGNVIKLRGATGTGEGELFVGWSGVSGAVSTLQYRSKRDVASANWSAWSRVYDTNHKPTPDEIGTYTKSEIDSKISAAGKVQSVNGKTGAVTITATEIGALQSNWFVDAGGSEPYPRFAKNDWLRACQSEGGFLPFANGGSYLGTSGWRFKQAWVNSYNGNTMALSGDITMGGTAISLKRDGRKHVSFIKGDGNAVGYIYVDDGTSDGIKFNRGVRGGEFGFNSEGLIVYSIASRGSAGVIRTGEGSVTGGSWVGWKDRNSAVSVDVNKSQIQNSAFSLLKCTAWGFDHLMAMDIHCPSSSASATQLRIVTATNKDWMFFANTGDFRSSGNVIAYSDERIKTNIRVIDNALDKVCQIRGVTYDRTDIEGNNRHVGVIAQEVEKVLPEAVSTTRNESLDIDDFKSVAYGNMVGLLIEAIKELKAEIDVLKNKTETN